jgi:hypothetical protein
MFAKTGLHLDRGREGDDRGDRPEAEKHAPTFAKTSPEDPALFTGHDAVFIVDLCFKLITKSTKHLKLSLVYLYISKSSLFALRVKISNSGELIFCKSGSM